MPKSAEKWKNSIDGSIYGKRKKSKISMKKLPKMVIFWLFHFLTVFFAFFKNEYFFQEKFTLFQNYAHYIYPKNTIFQKIIDFSKSKKKPLKNEWFFWLRKRPKNAIFGHFGKMGNFQVFGPKNGLLRDFSPLTTLFLIFFILAKNPDFRAFLGVFSVLSKMVIFYDFFDFSNHFSLGQNRPSLYELKIF